MRLRNRALCSSSSAMRIEAPGVTVLRRCKTRDFAKLVMFLLGFPTWADINGREVKDACNDRDADSRNVRDNCHSRGAFDEGDQTDPGSRDRPQGDSRGT